MKLAEGERATLLHEIDGYRAEAQEQQKARGGDVARAVTAFATVVSSILKPAAQWLGNCDTKFGHQTVGSKLRHLPNQVAD